VSHPEQEKMTDDFLVQLGIDEESDETNDILPLKNEPSGKATEHSPSIAAKLKASFKLVIAMFTCSYSLVDYV
jgi:hypothetical protein